MLLSFGTSLPLIFGLFTVRIVPHAEIAVSEQHPPRHSLEAALLDEEEGEPRRSESWETHTDVATAGVYAHLSDGELEEEEGEGESRADSGAGTPLDESGGQTEQHPLQLSPSQARNLQLPPQHSRQTSSSSRSRKSHPRHEHVNVHGWHLLRSGDFWILVGIMSCCEFPCVLGAPDKS